MGRGSYTGYLSILATGNSWHGLRVLYLIPSIYNNGK
jgi:D-alanyl-lipoteichoic acid acyltransferase DltB (MBOAT superfamily)